MKTNTNPPAPASLLSGGPRYFHLLGDTELDELRPVLESVQKHRNRVLEHWYQLYVLHFDDSRALTKTEFMEIFGGELDATLKDLLDKNMDAFAADIARTGRTYQAFAKLSHIRIVVLADTYFRSKTAVSGARIMALEREAGALPNHSRSRFHGMVGASSAMRQLYDRVEAAAPRG